MKISILLLLSLTLVLTYKLTDEKGEYKITTANGIILGGKLTSIYGGVRVIDTATTDRTKTPSTSILVINTFIFLN
jgi:hypothetical protein